MFRVTAPIAPQLTKFLKLFKWYNCSKPHDRNLRLEAARCGADMKKIWMGSTQHNNQNFASEGSRVLHSAKMPSMGSFHAPQPIIFLSEWCRCGANMKKPWMGSTLMYVPFRALIEASQMRRYHKKIMRRSYRRGYSPLALRGCREDLLPTVPSLEDHT